MSDRLGCTWKRITLGSLLIAGAAVLCTWATIFNIPEPTQRSFKLEDLFLDETDLPSEWQVDPDGLVRACISAPLGSGCKSRRARQLFFFHPGGHGFEEIHQYVNVEHATKDYGRFCKNAFSGNQFSSQWTVPPELPYRSTTADRFRFGCQTHGNSRYCQYVGQYEEFIVRFHTHKRGVSYQALRTVLEAIDGRMAHYLKGEERTVRSGRVQIHYTFRTHQSHAPFESQPTFRLWVSECEE